MQRVDDMELGLPVGAAGQAAHGVVARAHMRVDVGQRLLRLHHQPAPALQVEPERHVVRHRMAAADIHIGAAVLPGKHQVEVVVLQVLRIGDVHHFACCVRRLIRIYCAKSYSFVDRARTLRQFHDTADPRQRRRPAAGLRRAVLRRLGRGAQRPARLCRGRGGPGAVPGRRRHGHPGVQRPGSGRRRRAGAGQDRRPPRRLGRHRLLRRHRAPPHRREGLPPPASGRPAGPRPQPVLAPARSRTRRWKRRTPSSAPVCATRSRRRSRPTAT